MQEMCAPCGRDAVEVETITRPPSRQETSGANLFTAAERLSSIPNPIVDYQIPYPIFHLPPPP
jgi:hypothetical protein